MRFSFFGGLLLILLGISMILPIGLPIFRIVVAIAIIIYGIQMLGNNSSAKKNKEHPHFFREYGENNSIFQKRRIKISDQQSDYNIIFGAGEINLSDMDISNPRTININVLFGDARILIDDNLPIKLELISVLSNVELKDGDVSVLGKKTIKTSSYDNSNERIKVKVNAVFANVGMN